MAENQNELLFNLPSDLFDDELLLTLCEARTRIPRGSFFRLRDQEGSTLFALHTGRALLWHDGMYWHAPHGFVFSRSIAALQRLRKNNLQIIRHA